VRCAPARGWDRPDGCGTKQCDAGIETYGNRNIWPARVFPGRAAGPGRPVPPRRDRRCTWDVCPPFQSGRGVDRRV